MSLKETCTETSGYVVPIPAPGVSPINGLYFNNGAVSPTRVLGAGIPGVPIHRNINACIQEEEGIQDWVPQFTRFEVSDTYINLEPLTGNKNMLYAGMKLTDSPSRGGFYKSGYDSDRDGYSEVGGVVNIPVPLAAKFGSPVVGAGIGFAVAGPPGALIGGGAGLAFAALEELASDRIFKNGELTISLQVIAEPDALIDMIQEATNDALNVVEDVVSDAINTAEEAVEFVQQAIEKVDWIRDKANEIIDIFDGSTAQTVQSAYTRLQSLMV